MSDIVKMSKQLNVLAFLESYVRIELKDGPVSHYSYSAILEVIGKMQSCNIAEWDGHAVAVALGLRKDPLFPWVVEVFSEELARMGFTGTGEIKEVRQELMAGEVGKIMQEEGV
jgi:hypothetical protein